MNETAAERATRVNEFIIDVTGRAEWRMRNGDVTADMAYSREEVTLFKACTETLEAMLEWRVHERRTTVLQDGIAAIAAIRATARKTGEFIAITVSANVVRQLRGVIPHLVEYEVLKEKDALYSKRGRR